MVHKPKSVKYKVIAGYLLLFMVAVFSVYFIYNEILKIAQPAQVSQDNAKIIHISNTIADLYASEAIGRSYLLTGSQKEYDRYTSMLDSINSQIETIKQDVEESRVRKFDSIQLLLGRKKKSMAEIIAYRKTYTPEKAYRQTISGIHNVKDSIWNNTKPVKTEAKYEWQELVNQLLTPSQLDSLSKLPVSNDSLVLAFNKVLDDRFARERQVRYELFRKEQKLLEENRVISDQLRVILASVENEFLQKSYAKIRESEETITNTINTMAWVGAITLFFLIVFASIIIRDLTTNQNYRKQLEVLNRENEELLRSKSMLMATVTHDLQTPLGSIIGFHDLIRNSGITPKQQQYLKNIKDSADYILKLVNDLLDFSKLENNRISIERSAFNMKDIIENTCKTLEPIAVNKNIELNWDIEDELDSNFMSDPYRIKQVLTNLISNSIKFTQKGSVEVTAKAEGEKIYIAILDTGIGIAKDKQKEVFKEFTQAHTGIEKKFGGTGLGLTISKKITELLGGTIELESEEGQGSIFTIILPCIAAQNEEVPKEISPAGGASFNPVSEDAKILIVDDDNVQLALMKVLLSNYFSNVQTEINSSAVLPLLEKEHFDLVMTDIQMPVLDGFGLVQLIRNHTDTTIASLPVIALSGKRDLTAKDFTCKGFTAHHPKPVQLERLLEMLGGILNGESIITDAKKQTEQTETVPLYNLSSLMQFTNNDPKSLKNILDTFIGTAHENCGILLQAAHDNDGQKLAETAHKMIPMLKQMEVHSIAGLLVPLEDRTLNMTREETENYIKDICRRMDELVRELTVEK